MMMMMMDLPLPPPPYGPVKGPHKFIKDENPIFHLNGPAQETTTYFG